MMNLLNIYLVISITMYCSIVIVTMAVDSTEL